MSEMHPEIGPDQPQDPTAAHNFYIDPATQPDEPAILQIDRSGAVVRYEIAPHAGAQPITMEAGQREPGETLLAATRTLIIAADSRLVEAGLDSMVDTSPAIGRTLNPFKSIGRLAAKGFSAKEPLQSHPQTKAVSLFDPLTGRVILLEAKRWTEGVGKQDPTLTVTDKSRGVTSANRAGLRDQMLEIDPKVGVIKRSTVRPTTISSEVSSERPSDPANLLHMSAIIDRSHLLTEATYMATQNYGVDRIEDVRRIVGIEWQSPEPPDRSWQPAGWPR